MKSPISTLESGEIVLPTYKPASMLPLMESGELPPDGALVGGANGVPALPEWLTDNRVCGRKRVADDGVPNGSVGLPEASRKRPKPYHVVSAATDTAGLVHVAHAEAQTAAPELVAAAT